MLEEEHQILFDSAALNALKRHQLVSLSKRYGLKASGKNVDMVERLEEFASTVDPNAPLDLSLPSSTPAASVLDFAPSSPAPSHSNFPTEADTETPAPQHPTPTENPKRASRVSDGWEVLSDSGASFASPSANAGRGGMSKSASVSSWKSAGNGERMTEFGVGEGHVSSTRSKHSFRELASSIKRSASRSLLSRSGSASSQLAAEHVTTALAEGTAPAPQDEFVEEVMDPGPPSPASTVGIPRRYSRISLLERPGTVRLLASPSPEPLQAEPDNDDLPFFGKTPTPHLLKERRSLAPVRPPHAHLYPGGAMNRKSMPALPNIASASLSRVYPPLPLLHDIPPVPSLPGSFPQTAPAAPFVFGAGGGATISNAQFTGVADKLLAEMNAKMPEGMRFGQELLKGKKAEIEKLVAVNKDIGEGGFGLTLSSNGSKPDRFAAAHDREFSRMQSINSKLKSSQSSQKLSTAPSGVPVTPGTKRKHSSSGMPSEPRGLPESGGEGQANLRTKRSRLSPGPNYLGSLRDAGKSLVNLIGEGPSKPKHTPLSEIRKKNRRASIGRNKSLVERLGFSRHRRKLSMTKPPLPPSVASMPRSQSSNNVAPSVRTNKAAYSSDTLRRSVTSVRRRSGDLAAMLKRSPNLHVVQESQASDSNQRTQRDRGRSTWAQTVMSARSIQPRPRIPDFAPPSSSANGQPRTESTRAVGMPKSSSMSSGASMRKQSQAEIIRTARPAPPPPAEAVAKPTVSLPRSSTLYQPTASSIARMQATVKPGGRPLPAPPVPLVPPITPTANPSATRVFGAASDRDNMSIPKTPSTQHLSNLKTPSIQHLSNLKTPSIQHLPAPKTPSTQHPALKAKPSLHGSPLRSPMKQSSQTHLRAARAKASGLSAIKSQRDLREEREVQRKRSEIRERRERLGEERELRQMLGDVAVDRAVPDTGVGI